MRFSENAKSAVQLPKPNLGCFEIARISMRFDQHALAGLICAGSPGQGITRPKIAVHAPWFATMRFRAINFPRSA
jgi:hypothetical protein